MTIARLSIPDEGASLKADKMMKVWCIVRLVSSINGQVVPSWGGFISETGVKPTRLTTIDYYPVINHPITQNILQSKSVSGSPNKHLMKLVRSTPLQRLTWRYE
ncbi:hypothetical protein SNE40_002708 [Patella caerulea]|uniref:Uncharacterized protein n=1 Tax=Patella caerulea TaxID=87958 RepID=A0AAN8KCE9_PATCE